MYWIRFVASMYALVTFLNLIGQWWYANVPVKLGGSRLNPFNAPHWAHCIDVNVRHLTSLPVGCDELNKHSHIQWQWIAFMCLHALALACFAYDKWFGENRGGEGSLENGVVLGVIVMVVGYALKPKSPI